MYTTCFQLLCIRKIYIFGRERGRDRKAASVTTCYQLVTNRNPLYMFCNFPEMGKLFKKKKGFKTYFSYSTTINKQNKQKIRFLLYAGLG